MTGTSGEVEQAVSRTLRESLEMLQRTTEELSRAVGDLASASADARPVDSLAPMLRAQTAAATLSSSLEVLSRFVTASLQPELRSDAEQNAVAEARRPAEIHESKVQEQVDAPSEPTPELPPEPMPEDAPELSGETVTVEAVEASELGGDSAPEPMAAASDLGPETDQASADFQGELSPAGEPFDVSTLPAAEQELHRRANRVAKVSMQDIRMLRPDDVRLGREKKDLCERLRDDIEKAHKEYNRRFHTISAHPVDYFYDWMVEILGDGNPEALGEYPYPSPVLHR